MTTVNKNNNKQLLNKCLSNNKRMHQSMILEHNVILDEERNLMIKQMFILFLKIFCRTSHNRYNKLYHITYLMNKYIQEINVILFI